MDESKVTVDWWHEGAMVRNAGFTVDLATLIYEELTSKDPSMQTSNSNLEFWLGFYNLDK